MYIYIDAPCVILLIHIINYGNLNAHSLSKIGKMTHNLFQHMSIYLASIASNPFLDGNVNLTVNTNTYICIAFYFSVEILTAMVI